ncbi:MAG: ABC transporter substrate-binding protein [Polyangiaceae bacterium]
MTRAVKIGLYSVDPPGLTAFHTFDPESFSIIPAINEGLTYIDSEGEVQPALATSWKRLSPVEMEFTLRRGVVFHNGEPFDADCVVATFHAHKHPTPSACGGGILAPIKAVRKIDAHTIVLETEFPDAMLLRRLFFSAIYPKGVLEEHGRDYFANHPIGTGPFKFASYEPGREIVLDRNPDHWGNAAQVDRIRFPILRQKEWIDRLQRKELDAAFSIDSHDRVRAGRTPGLEAESRAAAISQWFLLSQNGPLADVRVRQALNHAVNRRLLVDITEHGMGSPQTSVATAEQQGYAECEPYRYSPELARRLLEEAGCAEGFTLRGLVSETSTAVYFAAREFLSRVGVTLEAEIVPRSEWIRRIVGGNLGGEPFAGDFAVALVDNPILHSLFHQFIFLFSQGPFSLLQDSDYDQAFLQAATTFEDEAGKVAQADLERYARDRALVLFTVQQHVHAAWREGLSVDLPRSGHFDVSAFISLRASQQLQPAHSLPPYASEKPERADTALLLEGTSHAGAFYLRPEASFSEPTLERIWNNIAASEQRWRLADEPMLRALVSQVEAKTNLANVLGSTDRVALVGYSAEGRQLFVNRGYELMFGDDGRPIFEYLGAEWDEMRSAVDASGSWLGPVHLSKDGRPDGAPDRLYLSLTRAVDEDGVAIGYTFVFSDFSGEEERIRNQAIRTILDNVPYGLFMCDGEGKVREGYSESCVSFFVDPDQGIEGRTLWSLLGLNSREADHFSVVYEQIFDDFLPEQVSLANLPKRVRVGERSYAITGSVIRNDDALIESVLFTLVDISDLVEAELEAETLRGEAQVMRFRSNFETFARDFDARLRELQRAPDGEEWEHRARRELHTAKGVFGQFGLVQSARRIHEVEDSPRITKQQVAEVHEDFQSLLRKNAKLWDIHLDPREARYTATGSALDQLEAELAGASSEAELRAVASRFLQAMRQKSVTQLVGPLADGCVQLADRRGKRVHLELAGGDVLCPSNLEPLFDVLPHLIRNSIDHGIESPEERGEKPELATIELAVEANDNGVAVRVSDDGRGIDAERVVERAIGLGILDAGRAAQLSRDEKLQLIFADSLSTAEDVTETSGRGVGMAAVKNLVEALGGTLSVRSASGRGTAIELHFAARAVAS